MGLSQALIKYIVRISDQCAIKSYNSIINDSYKYLVSILNLESVMII